MNRQQLSKKVKNAIHYYCHKQGFVSPINVFTYLDKLTKKDYENWRFKKVRYLERVISGNLNQFSFIMKEFRSYCIKLELNPSITMYNSWGKGKKQRLQFSKSGNSNVEKHYAIQYIVKKNKKEGLNDNPPVFRGGPKRLVFDLLGATTK
ncbi:hypothetical protein [Alteribacter populi]|uniref:hypothetical protein n=1 Tax=Alteribacter populi TaxID=2011011 RepID=UPI000BBAE65B|nr:hypothetical protein [Alteribacter populi]